MKKKIVILTFILILLISSMVLSYAGYNSISDIPTNEITSRPYWVDSRADNLILLSNQPIIYKNGYIQYSGNYKLFTSSGSTISNTLSAYTVLTTLNKITNSSHKLYDENNNIVYTPPATNTNSLGEQYALIASPPDGYKTVSKTISYLMNYRIKTSNASELIVHIKGINGNPLSENTNALNYGISSHTGKQVGLYYEGTLKIYVNYKSNFIGADGIIVSVQSTENNIFVSDLKNIEIVSFIDSNADGKDDFTNENAYIPPRNPGEGINPDNLDRTAYSDDIWGELQYLGDKLISFITLPFKFIVDSLNFVTQWANDSLSWINQISLFFSTFLGFLPMEIITAIQMLVYAFVIFGIVKLMRG